MIPKKIHYCWFGRGPKNKLALDCIESWKKYLPDYEFKEWNEDNFDINQNQYVKEAYENRKFAFVSDFVRLYALYSEGGIYMDTDVEVIKTYDPFLKHVAFCGFETKDRVQSGIMAAEKGSRWIKELLEQYRYRKFILEDGTFDMTTNVVVITDYMSSKGLRLDNTLQDMPGFCTIYPMDYFCPKDHRTGKIKCTGNTVGIHHYAGSWGNDKKLASLKHWLKLKLVSLFGETIMVPLANLVTGRSYRRAKHRR